jgi:hypothetical protein
VTCICGGTVQKGLFFFFFFCTAPLVFFLTPLSFFLSLSLSLSLSIRFSSFATVIISLWSSSPSVFQSFCSVSQLVPQSCLARPFFVALAFGLSLTITLHSLFTHSKHLTFSLPRPSVHLSCCPFVCLFFTLGSV